MEVDDVYKKLKNDIEEEKKKVALIEDLLKKIPKDVLNDIPTKTHPHQINHEKQKEIDENIKQKIDQIQQKNLQLNYSQALTDLTEIIKDKNVTKETKNNLYKEVFYTKNLYHKVEESLIKIKYPIFDGMNLLSIIQDIRKENEEQFNQIKQYIYLLNEISSSGYEEFPNFSMNRTPQESEIISNFLYKKVLSSSKKDTINQSFDLITQYLTKSLSNTYELISIIDPSLNSEKIIKYISNLLFTKLVQYFLSNKEYSLDGMELCDFISLMQNINEFNNEIMLNHYGYDSLKNSSLNDYIKNSFSINDNLDFLLPYQKEFISNVISQIKENIKTEIEKKKYNFDSIINTIQLLLNDNMSIYLTFRSFNTIDTILCSTLTELISIFKAYYNKDVNVFKNSSPKLPLSDILFLVKLLFGLLSIINNYFSNFEERTSLFDISFKEKASLSFIARVKECNSLLENYSKVITKIINSNDIFSMVTVKGLATEDINKINVVFNEAEKILDNFYDAVDLCKLDDNLLSFLIERCFKDFYLKLTEEIDNSLKKEAKGANVYIIIDKVKEYINKLVYLKDIESEDIERNVRGIYSILSNLSMNKI